MVLGIFGGGQERKEKAMRTVQLLEDLCSSPDYDNIDDTKIDLVAEIVDEHEPIVDTVIKFLKAKIKDESPQREVVALEVLDKCMVEIGYLCQHKVKRKILPRVMKMSNPKKQYPSMVQDTAKKMIWRWADLYGSEDPQLVGYMTAYQELRSWGLFEDEEQQSALSSDILED